VASPDAFSRDRLQPALLDRLIDDSPAQKAEAADARAITRQRLREGVLRDLQWLLNANAGLEDATHGGRFPHVRGSVLNFGIRSLSGLLASKIDVDELERMIRRAILDFEPRILPDGLRVRGRLPTDPLGHRNVLEFEISGRLWAQPYPLELLLRTDLDLETGLVQVREGAPSIGEMQRRVD